MFTKEQCFSLGKITKLHGLKGHVTAYIDSDSPELYFKMESVFLELGGNLVPFFISSLHPLKGNLVKVLFEDVNNLEEAEEIVGAPLFLPLEQLPALPDDQFYFFEIEGFEVWENGSQLGSILQVLDNPGNPLFEIETLDGREILVPIQDHFIEKLDKANRKIYLQLPEGLSDLNFD